MKMKQYQKVYQSIRDDILHGFLTKDDQLPSIRQAAIQFQVSKTTIEKAYIMLEDEGYIYACAQKGYYVLVDQDALTLRRQLLEPMQQEQPKYRYNLSKQAIDKDMFDFSIWKRYLKNVMELQDELVTYGDVIGEQSLRQALSQYAYRMRKVFAYPENIIVGASVQVLLYQVLALHDKKKIIAIHKNGYVQAKRVIKDLGHTIIFYETLTKEFLQHHHIDLLYIQHPMVYLNEKEREDILLWAQQNNTYIIEDDHNGELMDFHHIRSAWQKVDIHHIVYIGSFSRLLPSSFRISYVVLPQSLFDIFNKQKIQYSPSASKIEQLALANYIIDGHLERYVRKLARYYDRKAQYVYEMLRTIFPHEQIELESVHLRYLITVEVFNMDKLDKYLKNNGVCVTIKHQKLMISFAGSTQEDLYQALQIVQSALLQCR